MLQVCRLFSVAVLISAAAAMGQEDPEPVWHNTLNDVASSTIDGGVLQGSAPSFPPGTSGNKFQSTGDSRVFWGTSEVQTIFADWDNDAGVTVDAIFSGFGPGVTRNSGLWSVGHRNTDNFLIIAVQNTGSDNRFRINIRNATGHPSSGTTYTIETVALGLQAHIDYRVTVRQKIGENNSDLLVYLESLNDEGAQYAPGTVVGVLELPADYYWNFPLASGSGPSLGMHIGSRHPFDSATTRLQNGEALDEVRIFNGSYHPSEIPIPENGVVEYCELLVTPSETQTANAYRNEPATPESVIYQVANLGNVVTDYTVETTDDEGNPVAPSTYPWLSLVDTEGQPKSDGTVPVGGSDTVVVEFVDTDMPTGTYTAYITFTDDCDPVQQYIRRIDLEIIDCLGYVDNEAGVYRTMDADNSEPVVDEVVFTVTNLGVNPLTYTVQKVGPSCDWLTLDKSSGGPLNNLGDTDQVTAEIDATGQTVGLHTCEIEFTHSCGPEPGGAEIRTVYLSVRDEAYAAHWYAAEFMEWEGQDRDAVTPLVSFPNEDLVVILVPSGDPDPTDRGYPAGWLTQGLIGVYPRTAKFYYNWFSWARSAFVTRDGVGLDPQLPLRADRYDPAKGLAWVWRQKLGNYTAMGTDIRRGPIQLLIPTAPGQEPDGRYSANVGCYNAYINILTDTISGSGDPIREIRILNNGGGRISGIEGYVLPQSLVDEYHIWSVSACFDASFDSNNAYWNLWVGGQQVMFTGSNGSVEGPGGKIYSFRTGEVVSRQPYIRYGEMSNDGTTWFWDMECDYIRMTTLDVPGAPYWDGEGWGPAVPPALCPPVWADANRDGVIDQQDFAYFQACYTGVGDPAQVFDDASICVCFDRDDMGGGVIGDGDLDGADLTVFETCAAYSGPGVPYDLETIDEECLTELPAPE